MKRFSLFVLAIPLLSIATMAQTPDPSVTPTVGSSITQAAVSPSPSPSPTPASNGAPNLHWTVEMFASAVMLASVIGVLWLVFRTYKVIGFSITPRHIQFVSVCLIVPTILILGLEKVLTSETTATLIGGLAGYLLSNLGKYEPPESDDGPGGNGKPRNSGQPASGGQGEDSSKDTAKEPAPDEPSTEETPPAEPLVTQTVTQGHQANLVDFEKRHPGPKLRQTGTPHE
ncbi:MAG TPA: hypothetical protein VMZ30_10620 [Pyrinomonadaceae bacterium]|nr:hypothetical protein [Pyrinomonadaceae bacterium]